LRIIALSSCFVAVIVVALASSITRRPVLPEAGRDRLALAIMGKAPFDEHLSCAAGGHRRTPNADTLALTLAVSSVEAYARPAWIRHLKSLYLAAYRGAFNTLPDISVGPAQVRVRNIIWITRWPITVSPEQLTNDCANLSIAYCLLSGLRNDRQLTEENVADIARAYNGQKRSAALEQSRQYVSLVSRIFALTRDRLAHQRMAWPERVMHDHICL
jgi:hypothetical protein